jgi:hypothetical protein
MKQIERVDDPPAPFVPNEEWIDQFETQASEELLDAVADFAAMRARMVLKLGGIADELYVRELVLEALEDTWTGVVRWDPARVSLADHVRGVIRSRTRHHRKRAQRFRRQSIDANDERGALAEAEASLAASMLPEGDAEAIAQRALDEMRSAASGDPDVVRLLDAFERDATKKAEVISFTGMSAHRYQAARKRMLRLVKHLSPELRAAVARLRA